MQFISGASDLIKNFEGWSALYNKGEVKVRNLNFQHLLTYLEHFNKEINVVTKVLKYYDGVLLKKNSENFK